MCTTTTWPTVDHESNEGSEKKMRQKKAEQNEGGKIINEATCSSDGFKTGAGLNKELLQQPTLKCSDLSGAVPCKPCRLFLDLPGGLTPSIRPVYQLCTNVGTALVLPFADRSLAYPLKPLSIALLPSLQLHPTTFGLSALFLVEESQQLVGWCPTRAAPLQLGFTNR
jgi:hypothetical protein